LIHRHLVFEHKTSEGVAVAPWRHLFENIVALFKPFDTPSGRRTSPFGTVNHMITFSFALVAFCQTYRWGAVLI